MSRNRVVQCLFTLSIFPFFVKRFTITQLSLFGPLTADICVASSSDDYPTSVIELLLNECQITSTLK